MSKDEQDDTVHTCNFCGVTDDDEKIDAMVMGPDGTLICCGCIASAQALLLDKKITDVDFKRYMAHQPRPSTKKLRPITRIPKSWIICDTHLLKTVPSVIACSEDGQRCEEFSIPMQLALWMINYNEQKDIDKIREELKKDLASEVRKALWRY